MLAYLPDTAGEAHKNNNSKMVKRCLWGQSWECEVKHAQFDNETTLGIEISSKKLLKHIAFT